jgi:hypothetical protein
MRMSQRAAAVSGLAALTITLAASAASAHVTANPNTAAPGSYSKISFRVPNEEPKPDQFQEFDVSLGPLPTSAKVPAAASKASSPDDGTARLLGGLGLAAGVIGVAIGAYGLMRRRSA